MTTERTSLMRHLFAKIRSAGIGDRHNWATDELRTSRGTTITTFKSLSVADLRVLIGALDRAEKQSLDDYVLCGAISPDDQPCVLPAGHDESGCVDERGNEWMPRW